jgi:CelD/BcsL family acetyltransferase involved in cellulose biosynthesis
MNLEIAISRSEMAEAVRRWRTLAESMPSPSLGQLPDYYLAYEASFELPELGFFIATVMDGDRVAGIFPLCQSQRSFAGIPFRVLQFPQVPMPVRDVLIDPAFDPKEVFSCLAHGLRESKQVRCDLLHFREVLESSSLMQAGPDLPCGSFLQTHIGRSNLLDVSEGNYVSNKLNSKARNNLKRNTRKLAELGVYRFETVDRFPELDKAFTYFLETEAAGWKSERGGKRAVKLHADHTAFYSDLMQRWAGRCHIHLLYLDEVPIASDFCILTADSCYTLKHGYDEAYSSVAPGSLLRAYALEYYCQQPSIQSVDLISGLSWQLVWRPLSRDLYDIKFFFNGIRGSMLRRLFEMKEQSSKPGEKR